LFHCPIDAEKWCEIHHTTQYDLEECRTYLNRKKKENKLAAPEPRWGGHRQANADNNEQHDKINIIFEGSLLIASKTQGKKPEQEINLAQQIELGRRMKWSDTNISFGPKDHP
jgi:hypothetical protein